jgi:putative transposase
VPHRFRWRCAGGTCEPTRKTNFQSPPPGVDGLCGRLLADGRKLDDFSRECWRSWSTSITGRRVAAALERLADLRGPPRSITVDHGLEFEGQVPDAWAYAQNVQLGFVRPGKPVENAYVEPYKGKFP